MTIAEAISRNLKRLVAERVTNVGIMCDVLGISRTMFYRYLNGANVPNVSRALAIAEYFGIGLDDLVEGADRVEENDI